MRSDRGKQPPHQYTCWERESEGVTILPEAPKIEPEFFHDQVLLPHSYLSTSPISCPRFMCSWTPSLTFPSICVLSLTLFLKIAWMPMIFRSVFQMPSFCLNFRTWSQRPIGTFIWSLQRLLKLSMSKYVHIFPHLPNQNKNVCFYSTVFWIRITIQPIVQDAVLQIILTLTADISGYHFLLVLLLWSNHLHLSIPVDSVLVQAFILLCSGCVGSLCLSSFHLSTPSNPSSMLPLKVSFQTMHAVTPLHWVNS